MRTSPRARTVITLAGAVLALQWSLTAQTPNLPTGAKRPLSYDVVDYWKSIQGTRLSEDGQWLAYATSAPGDDGEVIVRHLRSGQEFKHARGTSPAFTPDARFVIFTIAQPKADEEKDAAEAPTAPAGSEETGRAGRSAAVRTPKTGLGIMTLADGQVKTFDKIGSFKLPQKSSAWVAYHKGLGGGDGAGRSGGRGGAPAAPGAPGARAAEGTTPQGEKAPREKRKDPRAD